MKPDEPPGHELDHVALGLPRLADAVPFLAGELGGRAFDGGPGVGFRWVQWRFAGGGVIEALEPEGPPDGFLHRFLAARGPGIHHVTFKVPSLEDAAERARRCGYDVVGWFDAVPAWKECFLHPKQAQGIVVQLAESNPQLEPGPPPDWAGWLPEAPRAPRAATVRGVRLSARDEGAARRQWCDALGGQLEAEAPDQLGFSWPGSALRIDVVIRPEAEEGPLSIELAPPRGWPEGGVKRLGARFVEGV